MKPGRPKQHIKPTYISLNTSGKTIFYDLDAKGSLIKVNGRFKVHHVRELDVVARKEEKISEPQSPAVLDWERVPDIETTMMQIDCPFALNFEETGFGGDADFKFDDFAMFDREEPLLMEGIAIPDFSAL